MRTVVAPRAGRGPLLFAGFVCMLLALPWLARSQAGSTCGLAGNVQLPGASGTFERIEVILLSSDRRPIRHVFTDSLGAFRIPGIGPGEYLLVVEKDGFKRLESSVFIPPRCQSLHFRYFVLEPEPAGAKPLGLEVVSAGRFQVAPEARKLAERGERELRRGRLDRAADFFDRALEIAPEFADALSGRGLVALEAQDHPAAIVYFRRAVEADPTLFQAQLGLGTCYARMGLPAESLGPLTEAVRLHSSAFLPRFERCRALFDLGRYAEAAEDCQAAREAPGGARPELHALTGNLYLRTDRLPEALREFERFLRLAPESPAASQVRQTVTAMRRAGIRPPR